MPALLERAAALVPRLGAAPDDIQAATVQATIDVLWAALYLFDGAGAGARAGGSGARAAGTAESPLYGWAIFLEGVALAVDRHPERALEVLTAALAEGGRQGRSLVTARALFGLTFAHSLSGRLGDMEAAATRLLELHEAAGRVVGAGWAHYFLGMLNYEWDRRDQAREHFGWVIARRHLVHHLVLRDSILATAMPDHIEVSAAAIRGAARQSGTPRPQHGQL